MEWATKESLFSSKSDFETIQLRNGEWVQVCEISTVDRTEIGLAASEGSASRKLFQSMLVAASVRVDGERLFAADDVEKIAAAPFGVFEPVISAAMRINGFSESDVDELEKN